MDSHLRPLAAVILNGLLIAAAGLFGIVGLLVAGEWRIVGTSLAAVIAFPFVLLTLHWLRWLLDIPAALCADIGYRLLAGLLAYLADLFVSAMVIGWVAAAVFLVAADNPGWSALVWGYAIVAGPLLFLFMRPGGYPMMVWLYFVAQIAYPVAWGLLRLGLLSLDAVFIALALLAALAPLIEFSRRWRRHTAPD